MVYRTRTRTPLGDYEKRRQALRTSGDKVFHALELVGTFGLEHRMRGQIDAIGCKLPKAKSTTNSSDDPNLIGP